MSSPNAVATLAVVSQGHVCRLGVAISIVPIIYGTIVLSPTITREQHFSFFQQRLPFAIRVKVALPTSFFHYFHGVEASEELHISIISIIKAVHDIFLSAGDWPLPLGVAVIQSWLYEPR